MMSWWRSLLDSFNTPGGHILLLFVLFNEGVFFYHYLDPTGGGQVMNLSFGALMGYLSAKALSSSENTPKA